MSGSSRERVEPALRGAIWMALALFAMSCGDRAPSTPPPTAASAPPPTTSSAPASTATPSMPSAPSITRPHPVTQLPDCVPSWRALAVHRPAAVVRVLSAWAPIRPFGLSHGETVPAYAFGVEVTRWLGAEPGIGGTPRSLERRGNLPFDRYTRGIARIVPFETVEAQVRAAVGGELVVLLGWTEATSRGVCILEGCIVPSSPAVQEAIIAELADQAADVSRDPPSVPAAVAAINAMTRPGAGLDSLRTLLAMGPAALPDLIRHLRDSRVTHLYDVDFVGPSSAQTRRHSVTTVGAAGIALLEESTGLTCPCGADVRSTPDGEQCGRCWRIVAAKAARHASRRLVSHCAAPAP